ncbi:unnamed protein product [Mycena citricolor]|uniref:Exonuclease V n=1 Tax=Mycena citricolor TaxID=2018698 RepID=A0AAD2H059_9AGAR|nr:unnamed protein product [Mycena citricolor]CAK5265923.1 unnamed protein product [Mycena citricolor]
MSQSDDSEYAAYNDFEGLEEADFASLDASTSAHFATPQGKPSPVCQPAVEEPTATSPFRLFRKNGTLSVTDLISLSWCEVQYDYGLRQRRSAKLEKRPASFKTEKGKEITVRKDVAARNDRTTKRGQVIHKELERQVKPVEIEVLIASDEERWALRILNLLQSLSILKLEPRTREIPVFGMIDNVVVVGIVDELQNISIASSPALRVIDTKTRISKSLPSDADAEPARLQVMLYHSLLTRLLETSAPFDFESLWRMSKVNRNTELSTRFLEQVGLSLGTSSPTSLVEVSTYYHRRIVELDLPPLDDVLQVVYRPQKKAILRSLRPARPTREAEDLARAIELSLADQADADLAQALRASLWDPGTGIPEDSAPVQTGSSNIRREDIVPAASGSADGGGVEGTVDGNTILGTKEFVFDSPTLNVYVKSAMLWWKGRRKPRGVSESQTRRCFSCEYREGCEWREEKAAEAEEDVLWRQLGDW